MTTWSIGGSQGSYRPEEPSSMGAGNDTHGLVPGEGVEPPDNRSAVGHISRSVTRARLATNFESVFKVPVAGRGLARKVFLRGPLRRTCAAPRSGSGPHRVRACASDHRGRG